jgi:hypothetical protein
MFPVEDELIAMSCGMHMRILLGRGAVGTAGTVDDWHTWYGWT